MRLRVAKAIHKDRTHGRDWESEAEIMKGFYLACAAAAFPAMRNPTAEMIAAGQSKYAQGHFREMWRAMCDEAAK